MALVLVACKLVAYDLASIKWLTPLRKIVQTFCKRAEEIIWFSLSSSLFNFKSLHALDSNKDFSLKSGKNCQVLR